MIPDQRAAVNAAFQTLAEDKIGNSFMLQHFPVNLYLYKPMINIIYSYTDTIVHLMMKTSE